jgi:ABC-type branched-subunit amino acid transport system ATPase component
MIGIGRALMLSPDLLLLDEPSAGLAPVMRDMVFGKLTVINESGTSILIVEQNAKRSLKISDRGYVLGQGLFVSEQKRVLKHIQK